MDPDKDVTYCWVLYGGVVPDVMWPHVAMFRQPIALRGILSETIGDQGRDESKKVHGFSNEFDHWGLQEASYLQ